jgi:hypothetical protein
MHMRHLVLTVIIALPALAQPAPEPDPQALQKLLSEVHELRVAIDRSTLLGARTQIALQRMQIQETRTNRLAQDYESAHRQAEEIAANKVRMTTQGKDVEERAAQTTEPQMRRELEDQIKQYKLAIETVAGQEQRMRARETELAGQLQLEQNRLQDLYSRVDEMERALDTAIRQITGKQ